MLPPSSDTAGVRSRPRRYGPSWVDRLQRQVQRLPWPGWVTYAGAGLVLVVLETAWKWSDTTYPVGTVFPYHVVAFSTGVFGLALLHYLDLAADRALTLMRPVLTLSEEAYDHARYRLTTMPASAAALAALLGVAFGLFQRFVIVPQEVEAFKYASAGASFYFESAVILVLDWSVIGAFVYHTGRQLHLIDELYRKHASVRLFDVRPLYAFSRLSAQNAFGIAAIGYAWIAAYPSEAGAGAVRLLLASIGVLVGLSVVMFVWPLWGAHVRLVDERDRRIQETQRRIEQVAAKLHDGVGGNDYTGMDGIQKAIAGLTTELTLLERTSTWPWKTTTLRGFLTAVLLPLFLWGAQQALSVAFLP